jgi:Arc/MetJ-type ribon-helix-helix transcriptional regulator
MAKNSMEDIPHCVRLSEKQIKILKELVRVGHASTMSEAIRDAIDAYGKKKKVV